MHFPVALLTLALLLESRRAKQSPLFLLLLTRTSSSLATRTNSTKISMGSSVSLPSSLVPSSDSHHPVNDTPTSTAQAATLPMRLPTLPPEIIEHIIRLSMPPLSLGTYRERHNTLNAVSLVNSTWNAEAQKELYRHPYVREKLPVCKLHYRLSTGGSNGHYVQTMHFVVAPLTSMTSVYNILLLSPSVEELWISNDASTEHTLFVLDLMQLVGAAPSESPHSAPLRSRNAANFSCADVKLLALQGFKLHNQAELATCPFDRLHSLALSCGHLEHLERVIAHLRVPNLVNLVLRGAGGYYAERALEALHRTITLFGPQLRRFAFLELRTEEYAPHVVLLGPRGRAMELNDTSSIPLHGHRSDPRGRGTTSLIGSHFATSSSLWRTLGD